jgi:hypothetical protein
MNDPLQWAAHYRQRATECVELADGSFEPGIEAHYRSLDATSNLPRRRKISALGKEARDRLSPRLYPTG